MRNFLLGALFGIVLSAASVIAWVSGNWVSENPASTDESSLSKDAGPNSKQHSSSELANDVQPEQHSAEATSVATNNATRFAPRPSQGTMMIRNPGSGANTNSGIPRHFEPIPLTEAHLKLLHVQAPDGSSGLRQHMHLDMQPRDDAWAYQMEQLLSSFFSSRGRQAGVEIANITCRTSTCEIQAFNAPGTRIFRDMLGDASKQPWWEFTGTQLRSDVYQDRESIFAFLEQPRKTTKP